MKKPRSANQTLTCSEEEVDQLSQDLIYVTDKMLLQDIKNKVINQDFFSAVPYLPEQSVDLLILDPPYNISKDYNGYKFKEKETGEYQTWFNSLIELVKPLLKPNSTIYVCSDWKTSLIIAPILMDHFNVHNRITWEREKGRGAKTNWKNNTEDIWFCTLSKKYVFNIDSVKLKRKVIAPYRDANGDPKDWKEEADGDYRLTHPSNIWTDITIPFWSMPENTNHPTQKPEKLIAKLILASSNLDDVVFDPFLGSGTTAVVSSKLGRRFIGTELNKEYCCWALKRLHLSKSKPSIQGFADGVFWERNSLSMQKTPTKSKKVHQNKVDKKPDPVSYNFD